MNDIGRQTAAILAAHYPADDALLRRAAVIAERLAAVNPHMNLTALTSPEEIALLHIYDSLALRLYALRTAFRRGCMPCRRAGGRFFVSGGLAEPCLPKKFAKTLDKTKKGVYTYCTTRNSTVPCAPCKAARR